MTLFDVMTYLALAVVLAMLIADGYRANKEIEAINARIDALVELLKEVKDNE